MLVQASVIVLSVTLQATAAAYYRQSLLETSNQCPSGVHIVGISGTLELPGFGALQDVFDQVLEQLPGSDSKVINYPVPGITISDDGKPIYNFFQYKALEAQSLARCSAEIQDFTEKCPDTGTVVVGCSQGAHIVGDALCGVTGGLFTPLPPLDYDFMHPSYYSALEIRPTLEACHGMWEIPRTDAYSHDRISSPAHSTEITGSHIVTRTTSFVIEVFRSESILGYVERGRGATVDFIVKKVKESQSRVFEYRVKNEDL